MIPRCPVGVLALAAIVLAGGPHHMSIAEPAPKTGQTSTAAASKNVTPEEATKLIASGNVTVLDIRTPEEFADGHIKGAVNIDVFDRDFLKKVDALDKKRPVIVHCASGGRSTNALPKIKALQFSTVYHMNGGFHAWVDASQPVAK